jgi:hypothetical protein
MSSPTMTRSQPSSPVAVRSVVVSMAWLCLVLGVSLAGCSEPSTGGTKAATVSCQLDSDCNYPNARCNATKSTCYTLGCDVLCAAGQSCDPIAKKCVIFGNTGDAITGGKDGSDAGSTTDASVSDGTPADSDDSTSVPDTETPPDSGPSTPNDKSCGKCKVDADCGTDFQCISLISGNFCARKCAAATDCAAGYNCAQASSDPKNTQTYCVLPSFDCAGCAGDPAGCPSGQKCNVKVGTPTCVAVKQQCEACNQDVDCDNGLRCVKQGDAKVCSPDCGGGKACPANSTCQSFFGIQACAFQADKCCYGSSCQVSTACKGCDASKCLGGQCVECVKDADCTGGSCNIAVHSCVKTADCSGAKPIKLAATGECVECANDTHCAASAVGPKCDPSTHTCGKGTQNTECAACGGAYPGCVEINGTWSCVECSTDKDCADKSKGTCSGKTYTCSGSVGAGTGPSSGTCKADSDCANGPSTTFSLKCDVKSGLCYDEKGFCDNLVAFCNAAAGSNCAPVGGLPTGGIPGLPGAGGGASACTCPLGGSGGTATMDPICSAVLKSGFAPPGLKNCDCAGNPTSPDCILPNLLDPTKPVDCCKAGGSGGLGQIGQLLSAFSCIGGGGASGGTPSESCFGGKCQDSGCLGALFGGGGTSTSTGQGSCAAGGGIGP